MKFIFENYLLWIICIMLACQSTNGGEKDDSEVENKETTSEPTENTLSEQEKTEGWELLFDGITTSSWKGYNKGTFPDKGWKVANGMLKVLKSGTEEAGHGGDIVTVDKFENFELSLDFMLTDTANSGIFYMVLEDENAAIWQNAPEYQILDDETYATMGSTNVHFTAANYDLHPAETNYKKPVGEWNNARIIKKDAHVEHWLNGNKVVEYELWSPEWEALVAASKFKDYPQYGRTKSGHIGLQDHGHEVKFRNIKIRKL